MIRETFADKYNEEVRLIIRELFNICKLTMKHPGDLLTYSSFCRLKSIMPFDIYSCFAHPRYLQH